MSAKKNHKQSLKIIRCLSIKTQKKVLLQQQKSQIEDAIAKAQDDHISRCAQENQIALSQLEEKLLPIVASCTKESIQNGNYDQLLFLITLKLVCGVIVASS